MTVAEHCRVGVGSSVHLMKNDYDTYCGANLRQAYRAKLYKTSKPVTCKACLKIGNE